MPVARIAREWVHKRFDANVFIGEPSASDGAFDVKSFFPIDHEFYSDSLAGLSASGYLIEVARQANLALCHRYFEVPLESAFLVTSIDWRFEQAAPFVVPELTPFDVKTSVSDVGRRRGAVSRVVTRSEFRGSQGVFLTGGATFLISGSAVGAPSTSDAPPPSATPLRPLAPADAQVSSAGAALLGEADGARIPLLVDPEHPYFFEHPNVHVPGMMLLEAGKQAAVYAAQRAFSVLRGTYGDLHSGEIRFGRFADLSAPVWMTCNFVALEETERGYRLPVQIVFEQREREIGRIGGALSFIDAEEAMQASAILQLRRESTAPPALHQPARGEAL